jgi:Concanavalin A-like lectin/glucanases superfamily
LELGPIVDQEKDHRAGYFFGIDAFGHVGWQVEVNGQWRSLTSKVQLPLKKWAHVVGTFSPNNGLTIYINGESVGHLDVHGEWTADPEMGLLIGRIRHKVLPAEWLHPKYPVWFSLDGILDEIEIYSRTLNPREIQTAYRAANVPAGNVLSWPKLPAGPPGPGRFGAYYCTLKYQHAWDRLRRIGPDSDVVVRFENSPVRLVFWQGTSYIPAWVTENGKWYTDEFLEAGSHENCPAGKD